MNKKTFSIFIGGLYNSNSGAGKNALNFANVLSSTLNVKTEVIYYSQDFKFKKTLINPDVTVVEIPIFTNNKFIKRILEFLLIPIYIKLIIKSNYILIYGAVTGYKSIILLSKIMKKITIFRPTMLLLDDTSSLTNKYGSMFFSIRKKIFSYIDIFFYINPAFSEEHKKIFQRTDKIFESFQGVNHKKYFPLDNKEKYELKRELNIPLDKKIILSVGYLINRKGYSDIFKALSEVNEDYHYIIVGTYVTSTKDHISGWDNNQKKEMVDLYREGKKLLNSKVTFLGSSEIVDKYYKIADIFLLNSVQEGTPNVLLEAFASRNCVLTSDISGITNYLTKHQTNCLIHKNKEELSFNISKVLNDTNLQNELAISGYKDVTTRYTSENVVNAFFNKIKKYKNEY